MAKGYPLPRQYWIFTALAALFAVLLFVNIFRTNNWTGDKPFSAFSPEDWKLFVIFIAEEVALTAAMSACAIAGGRIIRKNMAQQGEYYAQFKLLGIKPGDYDDVWFDFSGAERALIVNNGDHYLLCVQEFNRKTEEWSPVGSVSVLDSMASVRRVLSDDFDFFCEENTKIDKYGNEIFRE